MKVFQHHIKIKESPHIEAGNIIISQQFWNDEIFQRSVILILEVNNSGTVGIILNKQTNLEVNEALPGMNVKDRLHYGGPENIRMIGFLHPEKFLKKAIHIVDDIYWGGDIYQIHSLIEHKEIETNAVKFYAGYVEWQPGHLEKEIIENKWWKASISLSEIINLSNIEMWSSKLMQQDNMYGVLHSVPDPCLN